jgi:phage-related protein (TIGR01555 family)
MAPRKTGSLTAQRAAIADEKRVAKATGRAIAGAIVHPETSTIRTVDSFQNFIAKLGVGADNLLSGSTYGFNPITRQRTLLEWIHRGSWIAGVAIDVVADDMTREGVDIIGPIKAEDRTKIEDAASRLDVWGQLNDNIKWSRLYGGSIAVYMIAGQDYSTPLRLETIDRGDFRGLCVLDRWQLQPHVDDIVTEEGPFMGLPKYYTVEGQAPGLRGKKVHYTRCIRLEGVRLPYQQRLTENLWGESELERVYDRLIAFDSATTGAAQLVYKIHLRSLGIKGLRTIVMQGGDGLLGLLGQVEMMRRFQMSEGITMIDADDTLETQSPPAISGLSEILIGFGQQLSGALQIPLVRLFGQSPAGLNSTGESDLKNYYGDIKQKQERDLGFHVPRMYRMIAQSEGIKVPDGFGTEFRSLWQLEEGDKAEIASKDSTTWTGLVEAGIATPVMAMRGLRNSGKEMQRFQEFTDEIIKDAEDMDQVPAATQVEAAEVKAGEEPGVEEDNPNTPSPKSSKDSKKKVSDAPWVESEHERKANGEFGRGGPARKAHTPRLARRSEIFASPNKGNLTFRSAMKAMRSPAQKKFESMAADTVSEVLKTRDVKVHTALGVWTDGAENSARIDFPIQPPDKQQYTAALIGKKAGQTAVLSWTPGSGAHHLYAINTGHALEVLSDKLEKAGILASTMEESDSGSTAFVLDMDGSLGKKIGALSKENGYDTTRERGTGEFVGGDTREGLANYDKIIERYERTHRRSEGRGGNAEPGVRGRSAETSLKLTRVKNPTFVCCDPKPVRKMLTKLETGKLGEEIAIAYMRDYMGAKGARHLNSDVNNSAVDLIAGKNLVEVKAGLVSNGKTAQHWRATIGQPGPSETAWLAKASPEKKREWNEAKAADILARKNAALKRARQEFGPGIQPKTLTTILNPDTKTADVFLFDGFHSRIAWNSPEVKKAYRGTYGY